jgi:hypothetical protein
MVAVEWDLFLNTNDTSWHSSDKNLYPSSDCKIYLIDGEGVLFCEGRQELFAMNTSATAVWLILEQGGNQKTLVNRLSTTYNITTEKALEETDKLLLQWSNTGLLLGTEHNRPTLSRPTTPIFETTHQTFAENIDGYSKKTYRLLDVVFRLVYTSPKQETLVHSVLQHLVCDEPIDQTGVVEIGLAHQGNYIFILVDKKIAQICKDLSSTVPSVNLLILNIALHQHNYLFQIHAGVIARQDQVLLLPAASGSGKSSLTAGLMHSGWSYLSDETAPFDKINFRVRPVPLAACLKTGSWKLLSQQYPVINKLTTFIREDKKHVRYLPPSLKVIAPDRSDGYLVKWIIFPKYISSSKTRLQPLQKMETIKLFLAQCLSLPTHLDQETIGNVINRLSSIESYSLEHSDLDTAIRLINKNCND